MNDWLRSLGWDGEIGAGLIEIILDLITDPAFVFSVLYSAVGKGSASSIKAGSGAADDVAKSAVDDMAKAGDDMAEAGGKIIKRIDDVFYGQSSLDKAFSKHAADFGTYPDGSNASKILFKNDINKLLKGGLQKSGTYRATQGTHVYNPSTRQWAFFNLDGSFNTAFKLSTDQYKYLIETGVVK